MLATRKRELAWVVAKYLTEGDSKLKDTRFQEILKKIGKNIEKASEIFDEKLGKDELIEFALQMMDEISGCTHIYPEFDRIELDKERRGRIAIVVLQAHLFRKGVRFDGLEREIGNFLSEYCQRNNLENSEAKALYKELVELAEEIYRETSQKYFEYLKKRSKWI